MDESFHPNAYFDGDDQQKLSLDSFLVMDMWSDTVIVLYIKWTVYMEIFVLWIASQRVGVDFLFSSGISNY